jgi:hypothetical protein
MPGIRDNIKNWWGKQKEEFNLQRVLASRDNAAKKHGVLYKTEMAKAEQRAKSKGDCDPYDLIMEKYAQRMEIRDNPKKYAAIEKLNAKTGKQQSKATGCSTVLTGLYGEGNMNKINENNMKGRGLGAWLGRLITGRRDSGVRATGKTAFDAQVKETGFNDGELKAVWKLQQCEAEIRNGTMTTEEVLSRETDSFGKKFNAEETIAKLKSQSTESRKQPAGMESAETIEKFRVMARDRAREIEEIYDKHCKDFFPQHYDNGVLDNAKANEEMSPKNTNNSKTLDRINTRASLAHAYMYSQGDTLEQIYGDSQECKDLRTKRGKEMMDKLSGSKEEAGKMYADIAKKLSDFPTPDMSSDAAIYNNMREIHFLRNASINLSQVINLRNENRDSIREYHDLEIALYKNMSETEKQRFTTMGQIGQSINYNGIEARINFMASGEYSPTPELFADKKYKRTPIQQMLTVFSAERQDYIKENFIPGKKMGDNKIVFKDNVTAHDKKMLEVVNGYNSDTMEKNITNTITNEQVRQIQKQVLNPKTKNKDSGHTRESYKELLNENRKSISTANNNERKSITPPKKNRETKI